ncbi:MAG: hypothetical protein RMM28_01140 [Thermoleophilia bacterium]|nr:hypothetical protein [Gaiellaceae bacterium]MDW8337729.1 hypothetical protein [Thermoleophilia bacterium]
MTARVIGASLVVLLLALAPASAGASATRPPVALTATPAHVGLAGNARASVRIVNTGSARVVVDVRTAGFALDLRGRPRIVKASEVRRSAATWLRLRPRMLVLAPGAASSVSIASRLPRRAEPGDHDALVLFTTRQRVQDGVAVRMRVGVVVVVRAPGAVVRRLELGGLRVARSGRVRTLELVVANRGTVTESVTRDAIVVTLSRSGRRLARLTAVPRTLRPGTRGVVQFRCPARVSGALRASVEVRSGAPGGFRRTYRIRV